MINTRFVYIIRAYAWSWQMDACPLLYTNKQLGMKSLAFFHFALEAVCKQKTSVNYAMLNSTI